MSGPAVTETEKIKQKNIETYEKALQEIINFDIKKIRNPAKYIRERLIPEKKGDKYTIVVNENPVELESMAKIITQFEEKWWKDLEAIITSFEDAWDYVAPHVADRYDVGIEVRMQSLSTQAKNAKNSMLSDKRIYDALYSRNKKSVFSKLKQSTYN